MEIDEIRSQISEMGKSAGHGSEENSKLFYSLLITLNGSGLVASLAFMRVFIELCQHKFISALNLSVRQNKSGAVMLSAPNYA